VASSAPSCSDVSTTPNLGQADVAFAIASIAASKVASCPFGAAREPLTLRTYWRAAARISSSVVGGAKWWRTRMLRHILRG